jgi:hypothetical protein
MSYQQTRSTQDAPFYPQNTANGVAMNSSVYPASTNVTVSEAGTSLAPAWETKIYTGTITDNNLVLVTLPSPPTADCTTIVATLAVIGTTGPVTGSFWSQKSEWFGRTVVGAAQVVQTATAPLTVGTNVGITSLAGFSLTAAAIGANIRFAIFFTGPAGTAKYTLKLDITRASY